MIGTNEGQNMTNRRGQREEEKEEGEVGKGQSAIPGEGQHQSFKVSVSEGLNRTGRSTHAVYMARVASSNSLSTMKSYESDVVNAVIFRYT